MALSHDGKRLISSGLDNEINIWRVNYRMPYNTFESCSIERKLQNTALISSLNVSQSLQENILISGDKDGKIYFRINPDLIKNGREATLGSYGVIVNKKDTVRSKISKTIADIVNQITRFFIGDDGNKASSGKVQYIFNKLTQDPLLINGIRALLVLYLVYTGISYMIGFAKVTQQEVINRILKIAFVAMIISPNSWVFFNTYLFSLLLNGSMELIYDIIQPITNIEKISVGNSTHTELVNTVFGMFDENN